MEIPKIVRQNKVSVYYPELRRIRYGSGTLKGKNVSHRAIRRANVR